MTKSLLHLVFIVGLTGSFFAESALASAPFARYVTPTKRVAEADVPKFMDDLEFDGLDLAIERQLDRYRSRSMYGQITMGQDVYPLRQIEKSLIQFRTLVREYKKCNEAKNRLETCRENFHSAVTSSFAVYEPDLKAGDPRYGEPEPVLFTGYYTPTIEGSKTPTPEYPHAVYRLPSDRALRASTRVEIDFQDRLKGKGLEVFYTDDLFELYLLHVQGGGRIKFKDKRKSTANYLTYEGTNGQAWHFISKHMLEKKYISEPTVEAQREFLQKNPHKEIEIYNTCPSYVYFRPTVEPPLGSDRVPLTDNRSIATDNGLYSFKGMLAFVEGERPHEDQGFVRTNRDIKFREYQRFYLDQDTGGAIKGKGRVDLYFGESPYAEMAAYNMKHTGHLYFLMLKK